jgi:hypothetical protein
MEAEKKRLEREEHCMGFEVGIFNDGQLEAEYLDWLVDERSVEIQRHFGKLWDYYANRMRG